MSSRLDATDLAILREMQAEGRISNVELARRVGMSAPPCLRRVRALEDAGYIKGFRARLDAKKLGFELASFAMVNLESQAEKDLVAFETRVRNWPTVRQCWRMSGETDFILICIAADLPAFQSFVSELTSLHGVKNVRTSLVLNHVKDEPAVPIAERHK